MVGIMLATSGVILQGVLRNPLADPYILGVSAGAGIGAALVLSYKWYFTFLGMSSVPIFAFLFALIMVFIVYRLSNIGERSSAETLILAGVAVSSFASAVLALIIIISGQMQSIYFWMLGSFSMATYGDIFTLLPYALIGVIMSYFYSKDLNALIIGEEMAYSMGVDVERVRMKMIIIATLMTAAAVSVSGLVGFVGLIIPHFVRLMIGQNYRFLVPFAAVSGAILMLVADTAARTVLSPMEIPIGIIMALIGAPFFIYVLKIKRTDNK
jgi:iron complex transport system permease protein